MRRRVKNATLALTAVVVALLSSACALTSKAELVQVRYFSPERAQVLLGSKDVTKKQRTINSTKPFQLRLGRVVSGSNLRERIAYRNAAYELGYYEDLRWNERPETYVRRALGRSLFEVHGLARALVGDVPTLDVEVVAFDELRLDAGRAVRIELTLLLYGEKRVLLDDTLTVDRPVLGSTPKIEDVIAAMANALDATTELVALKVQAALASRPSALPPDSEL